MPRAHRILASALLISLALHLLMLASAGSWWTPPAAEIPFPIEANLVSPPAKAVPAPPLARPKAIQAAPVAPAAVATPVPGPQPLEPPPEPVAAPAAVPVAVAVETAIPPPPLCRSRRSPPQRKPRYRPPCATFRNA